MSGDRTAVRPSDRQTVYAGIDAGGSHSEIVVVDSQRRVLARSRGPAAALRPGNTPDVLHVIATGIREALAQAQREGLRGLVVGAAGAGRASERNALETALREQRVADRVKVIGDGEAALQDAFPEGAGILLLAGTGSIGYARAASGAVHRVGGLGWQLGDEGSGYALGRAALGAAGRAAEGRGPATLLGEMIREKTGTTGLEGLVSWSQAASRHPVAEIARVASAAAGAGDAVATQLVEEAAHQLAAHATALLAWMGGSAPGIALTGGLLTGDSAVRARLIAALRQVAPGIAVSEIRVDPALGAATIALRL